MKRINIITKDNKGGLTRDASILKEVLANAGFRVSVFEVAKPTFSHKAHRITTYLVRLVSHALRRRPPYDVNLFLENVIPSWFSYARVNCLIPNQEWFKDTARPYLGRFDTVLCKTKNAQEIFSRLGCHTEFVSFTSLDRLDEKHIKNYDLFFHLAGGEAKQKGTKTVVDVWLRHPEWPRLTVRHRKETFLGPAPNIVYLTEVIDDRRLCEYQNFCGVHLCPSEAEGFGHCIVEAMSTRGVTVTTNAPPMNELVTTSRGLLVEFNRSEPQRLGMNYHVDPQSLERQIESIIDMDAVTKRELGERARRWYLENDRFFRKRLVEVIGDM